MSEKHRSAASCALATRDQTRNPGLCPDQESNQQPVGLMGRGPTGPHRSGLQVFSARIENYNLPVSFRRVFRADSSIGGGSCFRNSLGLSM